MKRKLAHIALAISALAYLPLANSSEDKLAFSQRSGTPILEICKTQACRPIKLPEQFKSDIKNGYVNITTSNIDNETKIVAATASTEGSANICSKLYRTDKLNSTLIALTPKNEVCNYSIKNKK